MYVAKVVILHSLSRAQRWFQKKKKKAQSFTNSSNTGVTGPTNLEPGLVSLLG
jgi:hypothetical protein